MGYRRNKQAPPSPPSSSARNSSSNPLRSSSDNSARNALAGPLRNASNNSARNNNEGTARSGKDFSAGSRHETRVRQEPPRPPRTAAPPPPPSRAPVLTTSSVATALPSEALLYGIAPVMEALRAGRRQIERIMIAENNGSGTDGHRIREIIASARTNNVPVRRIARAELNRFAAANLGNHQGVIAMVAAAPYQDADELLDGLAARVNTESPPLAIVLDEVEDPRNLGAIIRTAECAGLDAIFIPERRAAGLTETVAKAAAGALEYAQVARAGNIVRLIEELKKRGIWTVGADADAATPYTEWDWKQPCAIFFGGEGTGLRRLVRERCDALVHVPLHGRIASLNVSVAAGIVLYEAVRQRTASASLAYKPTHKEIKQAEQSKQDELSGVSLISEEASGADV